MGAPIVAHIGPAGPESPEDAYHRVASSDTLLTGAGFAGVRALPSPPKDFRNIVAGRRPAE